MINWLKDNYKNYQVTSQIPYIFAVWIPFHLMAIAGICLLDWSNINLLYLFLGWIVFGGYGTAIMLHRYFAHKSFEISEWAKPFLYWIAALSGQGSMIWWAALHRGYHHAYSDQPKDIHSPSKGFLFAYMGWMFTIKHNTVNLKYAIDLLRDKMIVWYHVNYNNIIWTTIVILFFVSPSFLIYFYIIPALIDLHTDGFVNSVCHSKWAGYTNFDTNDQSRNVPVLGYFGWGQGWHNNHHARPKSFDFGTSVSGRAHEFDPCLLLIPLIVPWKETKRLWGEWRNKCRG